MAVDGVIEAKVRLKEVALQLAGYAEQFERTDPDVAGDLDAASACVDEALKRLGRYGQSTS